MVEFTAQPQPARPQLTIGPLDCLPTIVLPNQQGEVVNLLEFMAGEMLVLLVVSDPRLPQTAQILRSFAEKAGVLQQRSNLFVVTETPPEVNRSLSLPFYLLSDVKGEFARLLGLGRNPQWGAAQQGNDNVAVLIADARMRITRVERAVTDPTLAEQVLRLLEERPQPEVRILGGFAPLLHVPQAFEPSFCDALMAAHQTQGSSQSTAPAVVGGQLTGVLTETKIRRDHGIKDPQLLAQISERFAKRIQPEIMRAFTRQVSGVEEYKVVSYDASSGGHFRAHRDNTMAHFAHRRFAMTVLLNSDFEGGYLRFAEYGPDLYRPPKGDAIIYSSTLLHEVTPVTQGSRFALIAHMFDEESRQRSPTFRR